MTFMNIYKSTGRLHVAQEAHIVNISFLIYMRFNTWLRRPIWRQVSNPKPWTQSHYFSLQILLTSFITFKTVRLTYFRLSSNILTSVIKGYIHPVAVLGKILGGWPLIIWEASTAKRNYHRTNKNSGAWTRFGACAPWLQHRTATGYITIVRVEVTGVFLWAGEWLRKKL